MAGLSNMPARPIWLLTYDVGGHVLRYASEPSTVTDGLGRSWEYLGGLEPLPLDSVRTLGSRSVTVKLDVNQDWPLLASRGIDLEDRDADIRIWFGTEVLDLAQQYIFGNTENVAYRTKEEPFQMRIRSDNTRDSLALPQSNAQATTETWPSSGRVGYDIPDPQTGIYYPVLIGYPGDHPKGNGTDIAEPAFKISLVEQHLGGGTSWFALASAAVEAQKIGLYDYTTDSNFQYIEPSVTGTTQDKVGQTVTYVEQGTLVPEAPFYGGLRNASGFGGGLLSPYSGNVLRDANEVLRFLIDFYAPGIELDTSRLYMGEAWLGRFKLDFALTRPTDVIDLIEKQILPLLQVIGVDGPNGYYWAPLKWAATRKDAVAWVNADRGMARLVGDITLWDEPVYNHITLQYRMNAQKMAPVSFRTLTAVEGNVLEFTRTGAKIPPISSSLPWLASTEVDTRLIGSGLCRWSQTRYGLREFVQTSEVIWDDSTALQILYGWMEKHAYRKRLVRYVGGLELQSLAPGDIIVLTDSQFYLDEVVAMVLERTLSVSEVSLDIALLEHPFQSKRSIV